jgi:pimeloyl-ACP methyl ester carboxylesterase
MASILGLLVLGYAGVCALLYFAQEWLLFFPQPTDPSAARRLEQWQQSIAVSDATLTGWVIPAKNPLDAPLLFYFGGNAEDISGTAFDLSAELDANVVLMNYRGYGGSEGAPSEAALFSDALAVYDSLAHSMTHNGRVVAFGRSLGSGVAVYLAAQRQIDALVLVTPYDSVRAVARRRFSWLPVSMLIRHPFDSSALAPDLDVPALIVIAGQDRVIPPAHARKLSQVWGGAVEEVLIDDAAHNSVHADADYWPLIRGFLERYR